MEARDGEQVEPDKVYVIPPNADMGIHNQKLLLMKPARPNGYNLPIDYFLQSLAEDQWNRAVAIIFSGMGTDGETGLRMIKEKLGLVMVQDPESSEYSSMPKSAIATNQVDYVLLPEEMPIKLIQYLNHPLLTEEATDQIKSENRDLNSIQKILMLLRSQTGHDFSQYKKNTITRRIDRRLAFHQLPDYTHYINFLRENPQEIEVLFNELLIGVTKFFRDGVAFDILKEKLIGLLKLKIETEPVRVWVAGCSTGEEAYSIAIILMEYYGTLKGRRQPKVQIFATDLDMEAIEHARTGVYLENIVADVSPDRLEKFFIRKENKFMVKKELREMIVFAQHNLIKDAPFTRLDLLCCRNVLIYLTTDLQRKIIPIFHYSLQRKGLLFMGPAETIGGFTDMFAPADPKWKIFERKEGAFGVGKMLDFPFNISKQNHVQKVDDFLKPGKNKTLAETFNKILLENFTPASVLINEKGNILYINGKTGKFLELTSGEAEMNIHQMAKEGLRYALGNAIHQAKANKVPITINDLKLKEEKDVRLVNIKVTPLQDPMMSGLVLVVFEDKGLLQRAAPRKKQEKDTMTNAMVEELEKELMFTKQQLHTTIEQMETSLEELKSTNEELQSTNEELQSTNEESLTTKEEMQSLNEELMTINMQYQSKAEELTQLNNDMKNLLDNTEIGTVFLNLNLVILRFTPQVKKLLNIIATDVGRSITDIAFNFEYPELAQDIKTVIETLAIQEKEVKTKNDDWYQLRIMPYRMLTFHRITSVKILESKLGVMQQYLQSLLPLMPIPALLLSNTLQMKAYNTAFLEFFNLHEQDLEDKPFHLLVHEVWKTSKLDPLFRECLHKELRLTMEHEFPNIGKKHITFIAKPCIERESKETLLVFITMQEQISK